MIGTFARGTLGLLLFGLILAQIPATAGTAPARPKPKSAVVHGKPSSAPDADVEKEIRARFAKSKISRHHFQVHVQGGIATIEGQTDVLQHKGTATRLAKSGGAVAVINKIEVSEAAKEKAAGNLEKGRRRAQIKRSEASTRSDKRSL